MSLPPRAFRFLILCLALGGLAMPAVLAGTVTLEWDPSADSTGYKVYIGSAPGAYTDSRDVGNVTTADVTSVPDCTLSYYATSAYNDAGESGKSNEIASWPRPSVDGVSPVQGEQGTSLDLTLSGLNYQPGATVELSNPGITVDSVTVNACGQLVAGITIGPGAALGAVDIFVSNASGIRGTADGMFSVVSDATAPVISLVDHADVTHVRATITWSTDEPSDSQVLYRPQGAETYIETAVDPALVTEHSLTLEGLSPETTYEYHVRSADGGGNASTSAPDRSFTTSASTFTYIVFEAESGTLTDPMQLGAGEDAFAGSWLDTPSGLPRGSEVDPLGTATFGVNVPEAGTWYLWVRMYGPDVAANSFFESMDGVARQLISTTGVGAWEWVAGRSYSLNAGLHDVELAGREAATRADRILLTDDPDFVPGEQPGGDVAPPATVIELAATPADSTNLLSWTNPADSDLSRTVVRYRTDGRYPVSPWDGLPVVDKAAVAGAADGHNHGGLTNGVTYYYSVFAIDESDNVAEPGRVASTPGGVVIPDPPRNLRVVRP